MTAGRDGNNVGESEVIVKRLGMPHEVKAQFHDQYTQIILKALQKLNWNEKVFSNSSQ